MRPMHPAQNWNKLGDDDFQHAMPASRCACIAIRSSSARDDPRGQYTTKMVRIGTIIEDKFKLIVI